MALAEGVSDSPSHPAIGANGEGVAMALSSSVGLAPDQPSMDPMNDSGGSDEMWVYASWTAGESVCLARPQLTR